MKKIKMLSLLGVMIISVLGLNSCSLFGTIGLKYRYDDTNESYSVVGYTGKSVDIEIPSKYKNNR